MSDFSDAHAKLCARELPHARGDAERFGFMLGALIEALALTIAVGARGDTAFINELCESASARLFEGVAEKAPIAALAAGRD